MQYFPGKQWKTVNVVMTSVNVVMTSGYVVMSALGPPFSYELSLPIRMHWITHNMLYEILCHCCKPHKAFEVLKIGVSLVLNKNG